MLRRLTRIAAKTNWLFVATIIVAVFHLAPLLHTGYLADDAGNSLVRGILHYYDINIFQLIYGDIKAWLAQARFYPLASVHIYLVFYLLPTLALYKALILILILTNLVLFQLLIKNICPIPGCAELSALFTLMLFQFRIYHDPILAFGGLVQFAFLYILISIIALCKYLEGAGPCWLIASVGTYLLALLTYEITYPMFLLHVLLVSFYTRSMSKIARIGMPFLGSALLCASVCIFLRTIFGTTVDETYQPNSSVVVYSKTLCKQLFAAMPLSYALTSGRQYLPSVPPPGQAWPIVAEFILAIGACLGAVRSMSRTRGDVRHVRWQRIPVIALVFLILPPLLTCLSPRYQREIFWGVGQMPVYIEYYGLGLFFAFIVARGAIQLTRQSRVVGALAIVVAVSAASVLSFTGYCNHVIAKKWAGGWYTERDDIEKALAAGLADAVPDGATLIPGHRYPWWHDTLGAYFYSQSCGKKLRFPGANPAGPEIPIIQRGTSGNHDRLPPSSRCYGLYDIRLDSTFSYVFLCELGANSTAPASSAAGQETRKGWLFVRSLRPKLQGLEPAFRITAPCNGTVWSARPEECTLVRQGKDWWLYDFETNGRPVDAQGLHLELVPTSNRY
jgi:hypothetical protein